MNDVVTAAPLARPAGAGTDVGHFQWGQWGLNLHETNQYNFFCGGKFFCVRLVELGNFRHQSAWVYDGEVRELLNAAEPIERIGDDRLNIRTPRFLMEADDAEGSVTVLSESSGPELEINFATSVSSSGTTPGTGAGVHKLLIQGKIAYRGQTYAGIGYCKRAYLEDDQQYWNWRFINGVVDDDRYALWTAEANFGLDKYDYLKIAYPDGTVLFADNRHTHHRDNTAYGAIDGTPYEVVVEEIGAWQTKLLGDNMDCLMRQRFCKMTVCHDGQEDKGYALHEAGLGTMR